MFFLTNSNPGKCLPSLCALKSISKGRISDDEIHCSSRKFQLEPGCVTTVPGTGIKRTRPHIHQHVLPNSLPISNAFVLISTVFFGTRRFTASRSDPGLSGIECDAAPSIITFCERGLPASSAILSASSRQRVCFFKAVIISS